MRNRRLSATVEAARLPRGRSTTASRVRHRCARPAHAGRSMSAGTGAPDPLVQTPTLTLIVRYRL